MTLSFELYWSFRSPYSYLVTDRVVALQRDYDVVCDLRIVYPIAVRQPEFFANSDPLWFSYFWRDIFRSAEFAGIPFAWPSPDPVYMDPATRTYPQDQPYIHRLTRLGAAAVEQGRGLEFIEQVGRLIWGGAVKGWHEGDHLASAAARAGLDLNALDAAIAAPGEAERLDALIATHQSQQRTGGHYGVPLMVFQGEPFFGQDRFDQLVWRMTRNGLAKRG
jgi:2-hydroxychromene-2-carboxylate isomerase